ncbi:MAG: hypothetical protein L0H84_02215 [Pseudonocardia sp.]|nr:hypothetical protein [Pseudonocardia sp.]
MDDDHGDDSEILVSLMRTAASARDAPPAAFGHAEVVATSRRITHRRRMLVAGAAGLVVIAGLGTTAVLPIVNRDAASSTVAGAPVPSAAPDRAPAAAGEAPTAPGRFESAPAAPPEQASPGDCGTQQDPELRALVFEVFPQVAGAAAAPVTQSCRGPGERAVHLQVSDGDATGILTVVSTPRNGSPPRGDASAPTASGGRVTVSVRSTGGGPAPFADDMGSLAAKLGPRL